MDIETIVRTRYKYTKEIYSYSYYICKDGIFTLEFEDGDYKFDGKHFISQGDTYFHHTSNCIAGLEILDEWYEIVDKLPDNLIK